MKLDFSEEFSAFILQHFHILQRIDANGAYMLIYINHQCLLVWNDQNAVACKSCFMTGLFTIDPHSSPHTKPGDSKQENWNWKEGSSRVWVERTSLPEWELSGNIWHSSNCIYTSKSFYSQLKNHWRQWMLRHFDHFFIRYLLLQPKSESAKHKQNQWNKLYWEEGCIFPLIL